MRCALLLAALLLLPAALQAQGAPQRDLRESQLRLDSIRQERLRLQKEMASLQSRVRDASRELINVSRQRTASVSALQELEFQASLLTSQMDSTKAQLENTHTLLRYRSSTLNDRLRSIYKRGPLHSVRVLLGAEDFADLLNRYKYLHLITLYDHRIVADVSELEQTLRGQEEQLQLTYTQLDNLRADTTVEGTQLRRLENANQKTVNEYKQQETQVAGRIDKAEQDEARLNGMIASLERDRREEEARRRAAGTAEVVGPVTSRMLGTLNWPVDGEVIYRFGPIRKPSGVTLINKGIGISAAVGAQVRAVEAGEVALARPFEGYGPTVMISHGSGYYSLYLFLRSIAVREGQQVTNGQSIGTVGGEGTPEGPHLYFQIHAPVRGLSPEPVDPMLWLRARRHP
jgi:septal ring factor EnvC (AmiA/AmiB activator)